MTLNTAFLRWTVVAASLTIAFAYPATASSPAVEAVQRSADEILRLTDIHRESYSQSPDALRQAIDAVLADTVDYLRIVRGVMGKHRDSLSSEQQARFTTVFRASMIQLYTDALVQLRAKKIEVEPLKSQAEERAQVGMLVTTDTGDKFDLTYSMIYIDGSWKVLNIMIDGINLGITYRNQFDSLMRSTSGDIELLINSWMRQTRESSDQPQAMRESNDAR